MARRVVLSPSSPPWHPGYPFRPRAAKTRRVMSGLTLAVLLTAIGGYYYVTDSRRVRTMAEKYLSEVAGGPVKIGRARLSIFEGLRLDRVSLLTDNSGKPESKLLEAESIQVSFSLPGLLRGNLSDVSLVAVEPRVLLVSYDKGEDWNFHKLRRPTPTTRPAGEEASRARTLPRVSLRNARISYAELKDGVLYPRDTYAVEGTLSPGQGALMGAPGSAKGKTAEADRYHFAVTARTAAATPGTSLSGWVDLSTGALSMRWQNFDLGNVENFLPGPMRDWWQRHEIAGSFDIPEFSVEPADEGKPRTFRVVARFQGGAAALHPDELQTPNAPRIPTGLPPIRFSDVRGEIQFTESGIALREMSLVHEGNKLVLSGDFRGYDPDAAFDLHVRCAKLNVPDKPAIVPSLPPEALEVYNRFVPAGEGSFDFRFSRKTAGPLYIDGRLDITNGRMAFERFPFTCYNLTGAVVVKTLEPGKSLLEVQNIRGSGKPGTPNEKADLRVYGWMYPLEGSSEVNFWVEGKNVVADEALVAAMPGDVKRTLKMFDAPTPGEPPREGNAGGRGTRTYPEFGGSFTCAVYRWPGPISYWYWPIDIKVAYGRGRFEPFPYPLEDLTGQIIVGNGRVDIKNVVATRKIEGVAPGAAPVMRVDGSVSYGDAVPGGGMLYDVAVRAERVPVDPTFIAAVPSDKREWLNRLGIGGRVDIDGKITGTDGDYDLGVRVSEGSLRPQGTTWSATGLTGELRVSDSQLAIVRASARRLGAPITASGLVTYAKGETPTLTLDVTADRLPLDAELRAALPADGRTAWDAVNPQGLADVRVEVRPEKPLHLDVTPLGLSVTPSVLPVRLDDVRGRVTIDGQRVTLTDLKARRKDSEIALAGTGSTLSRGLWEMTLSARRTEIDAELRAALPQILRDTFMNLSVAGVADVDVRRLAFRPGTGSAAATGSTPAATTRPALATSSAPSSAPTPATTRADAVGSDVDFDLVLTPVDLSLSLGVPVRATAGEVRLAGAIRDDRLAEVNGSVRIRTGEIAERPFTNLTLGVAKSPGQAGMRFDSIGGSLADGEFAGQAAVAFPDGQPVRYAMSLMLRDADVRGLVGKQAEGMSGRLTASLALEGSVDRPAERRGRGDISVTGDRMGKVPVLLGLVQVASLALPGDTSFNSASARYSIDGPRVSFEQIALRSPGVEMIGNGKIDLDQRDVRLTFWTAPPDGPKVPVLSDFMDKARRELLQINVRGTIDDPKISAGSFESFTTTIQEVTRSSGRTPTPTSSGSTTRK